MDFLLELFFGLIGAIFEGMIEAEKIPKWVRFSLLGILFGAILALIIDAIIAATEVVLAIFLFLLAIGVLALFLFLVYYMSRFGVLRPAKKEELSQVLNMYRSVIGRPGCTWSIAYPNEATLHEDFRTGNLFVLRHKGRIIGAGSIVPRNELDDLEFWQHKENAGEIARIVIHPDRQSRGHGKYLVDMLCHVLHKRGYKAVHLLAAQENRRALNLYRESNFHNMGHCHRYGHTFFAYERKL